LGDRISCYAALDIAACADFIKEIRMKCADAKNLDRKSGEHGAPVQGVALVVALGAFPQPVKACPSFETFLSLLKALLFRRAEFFPRPARVRGRENS
jgi:hypothetical protein